MNLALVLTITPYWHSQSQTWVIGGGPAGPVEEPLMEGAPQMIDALVQGIPNAKQGFRLLFSAQPFPGWQKKLTWLREEADGDRYACEDPRVEARLCPALLWYFDQAPPEIYVKAEAFGAETQYNGDYYEALARQEPVHKERLRLLAMALDADCAEDDVAMARGELVLSPYGRLLPAGDPALDPDYRPPRPPNVRFIARTRGSVLSLAVYPDHERLVSCEGFGSIQVWDLRSGQELCRREKVPNPIDQLAVSLDGSRVVGIDRSGSVFAWDSQTLTPIVEGANLESYATLLGLARTACRRLRSTVITKSGVEIYAEHGKLCAKWPRQGSVVILLDEGKPEFIYLAISEDGLYTAVWVSQAPDNYISVFATDDLLRANQSAGPDAPYSEAINSWVEDSEVQEIAFSPDNQTLAVMWPLGSGVGIWDFRKDKMDVYGAYTHQPIDAFAFLGNEQAVVARGDEIEVLDLELKAV